MSTSSSRTFTNGHSFELLARDFCELIEQCDSASDLLCRGRLLLAKLYASALELDSTEPGEDDNSRYISHADWQAVHERLTVLLDPHNRYEASLHPTENAELATAFLADDFADIWRDLKEGLNTLSDRPNLRADVFFDWKFTFEIHWGRHAVNALAALHDLAPQP